MKGRVGMRSIWVIIISVLVLAGTGCGPTRVKSDNVINAAGIGEGALQVFFMNTLNGDAAIIRLPDGKGVLIDSGSSDEGPHIVKCLNMLGITSLHAVILSHPDIDHYGSMAYIFKRKPVEHFYHSGLTSWPPTYMKFIRELLAADSTIHRLRQGDDLELAPDIFLSVYWPPAEIKSFNELSSHQSNTMSVVFRMVYTKGNASFLFTGDIKDDTELVLRDKYGMALQSDVLKVGHHGSGTSSSRKFINVVRPRLAVVMGDWYNLEGEAVHHPADSSIDHLKDVGAKVIRTSKDGICLVEVDESGIARVITARQLNKGNANILPFIPAENN